MYRSLVRPYDIPMPIYPSNLDIRNRSYRYNNAYSVSHVKYRFYCWITQLRNSTLIVFAHSKSAFIRIREAMKFIYSCRLPENQEGQE